MSISWHPCVVSHCAWRGILTPASRARACHVRSDQRDRGCEQSPPDHSQHQNPARSQPIRQPASRSLEERVAEHECAEHTSELYVGEMEFFGDGGTGNRDIDTIKISNGADQKHPT